ncbi:MAG: hypothetical protein ACO1OB_23425 [Archangium sp.]
MKHFVAIALLFAACTEPSENPALDRTGPVTGNLERSIGGDAWLFLYRPGEGPPGLPAEPVAVTSVSASRLVSDPRFVFANVKPNAYRLYGILDVDSNFDTADVLAQPTSGDRVSSGVEVQAQPGRGAVVDVAFSRVVHVDPPAFSFEGESDLDVVLDPALDAITPLTLIADDVGVFDAQRIGFTFGLIDEDGDGRPDDRDGDGTIDLSLQLFLRWLPRPGQVESGTTVIVPLVFDPSPFLRTLEGRLDTTVTSKRLQVVMVPQAISQGPSADGGVSTAPFGPPPAGDYELIALQSGGQFWRVPNQLAPRVSSQSVRLHVDRVSR